MQIIIFIAVAWVILDKLLKYESYEDKVKKSDNDPNCHSKSNKWRKQHPEWKGGYKL